MAFKNTLLGLNYKWQLRDAAGKRNRRLHCKSSGLQAENYATKSLHSLYEGIKELNLQKTPYWNHNWLPKLAPWHQMQSGEIGIISAKQKIWSSGGYMIAITWKIQLLLNGPVKNLKTKKVKIVRNQIFINYEDQLMMQWTQVQVKRTPSLFLYYVD